MVEATGRDVETDGLFAAQLTVTQPASPDGDSAAGTFCFHVALSHTDDWKIEAIDIVES